LEYWNDEMGAPVASGITLSNPSPGKREEDPWLPTTGLLSTQFLYQVSQIYPA
jgi:hypothetical protein